MNTHALAVKAEPAMTTRLGILTVALACTAAFFLAAPGALAQNADHAKHAQETKNAKQQETQTATDEETVGDGYFLDVCPVSGEELSTKEGEYINYHYKGREIRLCCKGCVKKIAKDPEKYIEKLDKKLIKMQKEWYPMDTCLVTDEELGAGDMGEPIDYLHGNRLVRFCCKGCIRRFEKDPDPYLEKLDAAVIEKQKDNYPVETCLVSGEALGGMGEPINYIIGNRLIRLCCKGCVKSVDTQPAKYMAALRKAYKDADKGEKHEKGDDH
ncbi:MAG: hypothetical protein HND57_00435 [Planctomycetes bacterium]|nr:hypothetical protein [Planctomycetota bacterium]